MNALLDSIPACGTAAGGSRSPHISAIDNCTRMAVSRPISDVLGSFIRVRYLTLSGWWPR